MDDGKTHVSKFPNVGATCKMQVGETSLIMLGSDQSKNIDDMPPSDSLVQDPNWGPSVNTLEHCPDFDERFTLTDGQTKAIPFPQVGFNCTPSYQMVQRLELQQKKDPNWGPGVNSLQHCPDFDERFTLTDGVTKAVAYPGIGYNCKSDYQLI